MAERRSTPRDRPVPVGGAGGRLPAELSVEEAAPGECRTSWPEGRIRDSGGDHGEHAGNPPRLNRTQLRGLAKLIARSISVGNSGNEDVYTAARRERSNVD